MLFPLTKARDFTNSLDKVGQERAKAHTHTGEALFHLHDVFQQCNENSYWHTSTPSGFRTSYNLQFSKWWHI